MGEPELKNKFLFVLQSRKFWACLIAVLSAVAAFAIKEITMWQMIQAIVAAAAAYATGVAIEDAGTKK